MYGGPDATAYFVRETRKATWFTQVPVVLSRASGTPAFGQEWSVSISRAGDYLLETWLRLTTPAVTLATNNSYTANGSISWTRNFMHNIIRECAITFNDLVAARFDNYHLDFWAAFTVPAGKRNGYANMVGDFPAMYGPHTLANPTIDSYTLNLPLPLFFTRDSGVALPTAALPYNDMRINFSFRDWTELLVVSQTQTNSTSTATGVRAKAATSSDVQNSTSIVLTGATQVWANYAIVSNDERKRMACAPRDILIEQVQTAPKQSFNTLNPQYDIRFSHAIKVLFFAARNTTISSNWSNYTTFSPLYIADGSNPPATYFAPSGTADPIKSTSLIYENTQRLSAMGSDYYSLVNPYYHAPVIPAETGYHMYSYSLDFICLDPMGSTNYGKLTNVSLNPEPSASAQSQYTSSSASNGWTQSFEFITTAVNNNIIRISGGALGKHGKPKIGRCFNSRGNTIRGKHFNTTNTHTRVC
jgi:hypothetical protein